VRDYTSEYNVWYASADLQASDRFHFLFDMNYTKSTGSFESIGVLQPVDGAPANADLDYSMINQYSDLDYQQIELTYGVNFRVGRASRLYGSITYLDLIDDQPYVYGDLDGSLTIVSTGMTVGF